MESSWEQMGRKWEERRGEAPAVRHPTACKELEALVRISSEPSVLYMDVRFGARRSEAVCSLGVVPNRVGLQILQMERTWQVSLNWDPK